MERNAIEPMWAGEGSEIGLNTCAACSGPVDTDEWHPIDVDVGDDGDVELRVFCSEACRREWESD